MLKASAQSAATKRQIVDAALETLKERGFAGTSARTIARRGGFNQALVFYHFGGVNQLLLAALEETSARRMHRYQQALDEVSTIPDGVRMARDIYREDLAAGHITVLSEMIAGSLTHPELAPPVVACIEPWVDFAERAVRKLIVGTALQEAIPARDLAFAIVAFYLGADLLTQLEGDRSHLDGLFEVAARFAPLGASLLHTGAPHDGEA